VQGSAEIRNVLGKAEQTMLIVASFFKGITINKKMRLYHDSLYHPETETETAT